MGAVAGGVAAAAAGAAVSAGASALTSGSKGSGGSQTQQKTLDPMIAPYVYGEAPAAQALYNQQQATGPYGGSFYSPINGTQQTSADNAALYANGSTAQGLPGQVAGAISNNLGVAGQYTGNAQSIYNNGIQGPNAGLMGTLQGYGTGTQTTQGPSSGLSSALDSAATSAAGGLGQYANNLTTASNQGLSDPTQRIANDASAYMNSSPVQSAVNSTNAMIDQTNNEQTIPGLNRQAAMGGSLNSSRAGMAEAMANEGASIAKGNADAAILNNAYNTGMGTASNLYASGLNSSISASNAGYGQGSNLALGTGNQQQGLNEFNTQTQLGAANSGLSQGLQYQLGNAQTQLAANQQLGTAVGQGIYGSTLPGQVAAGNFTLGENAGGVGQADQNAQLDNAYKQWQQQTQVPMQEYSNYANIINNAAGLQSGSITQNQLPPNTAGNIAGGAAAGAGLYQNLFGGSGSSSSGGPTTDQLAQIQNSAQAMYPTPYAGSSSDYGALSGVGLY